MGVLLQVQALQLLGDAYIPQHSVQMQQCGPKLSNCIMIKCCVLENTEVNR